jgi:hypothetical protein
MHLSRWVRPLLVAALALACVAVPATAQSPAPSGAALYYLIRNAVDGLASLDVFVYRSSEIVEEESPVESIMVVRRVPVPSVRLQIASEGEVAYETIAIDREAWTRSLGGPWTAFDDETDTGMQLATGIWPMEPRLLLDLYRAGIEMRSVGTDEVDGRRTLHFRGELPDDPAADLSGTLDLWVDAERGFLVRAEADVVDRDSQAMMRGLDSVRVREVIEVGSVDDPDVRIDPPDLSAGASPTAEGDPALAPVVDAAFARLADLVSYRATVVARVAGPETEVHFEVRTSPELRVRQTVVAPDGRPIIQLLAIGEQIWSRGSDDERWSTWDASVACAPGPCVAAALIDFAAPIAGQSGTFRMIAEDETIDGRPVRHLRSEAGFDAGGAQLVPGTVDLWVDRDGGHLVRLALDGQGIEQTITIHDLDDPTIVIETPTEDELAPSASPTGIWIDTESPPPIKGS